MKCGIIGLPNTGKSTFFNFISNSKVLSENFPFCTIEPNYGMTKVPDQRLYELKEIIQPMKIIPSEIKIVDIAGLIKGSHKGDGLGNKFLSHIRETNVIIHMIRLFHDISVIHVEGSINPIRDKEIIDMELQLKDLDTIENRLEKITKKNKNNRSINTLQKIFSFLKEGKNIRMYPFQEDEKKHIKDLQLLTEKPVLYVCNTDEKVNEFHHLHIKNLKKIVEMENSTLVVFSLKKNSISYGIEKILKKAYKLLNLQSFFTVGKKEIRAWSIPNQCTAYEASSVIHTDFKKGFIKAEVIHYNDFIKYKSEEKVKKAGKIFLAGKNYLIQDGDIIHFRFNR
ncbi:GTP-binding protein [Blattabacterium sp. (Blattella germanica) str. Bge]|uniref:redox-regulated ATPase YchF n=1 Tax=Blattabacterium sp. (Blattella germanica) TaxID=624186 RepID=UPI0001BB61CE|nr:redox-regulated ATPase YchF [Blattabacterium sp. (Blattella germanica)]ACY40408.1 GTP-binding protein [Blattabacterium sp. (Blattella germanica) str. Bge]